MLICGCRFQIGFLVVTATLRSLSIEIAQVAIPGRAPSLTHFLVNLTGVGLGAGFVHMGAGRHCMASFSRLGDFKGLAVPGQRR